MLARQLSNSEVYTQYEVFHSSLTKNDHLIIFSRTLPATMRDIPLKGVYIIALTKLLTSQDV